jgi:hypothetical protein
LNLTPEQAIEYKRCAKSCRYTIETYGYLKHIRKGKMKWVSYPWQLDMFDRLQAGQNLVVLKSRQVGASWTTAGFVAWLILFRPDIECLLLSQKEQKAIKLLAKVKFIVNNFPEFIRRDVCADTKTRFAVVHKRAGARIISESAVDSLTTTGESGRGDTARFVFLDEFAHLDNAEEVWTSIKPTTSHGGQIVAASSPNGTSGAFARLWMEADGGDSASFVPIRIHYTDCGFDEKWLAEASDGMTREQIDQEFELIFLSTGSPAFAPDDIRKCYIPMEQIESVAEYADLLRMIHKSVRFASGVDSAEIRRNKSVLMRDHNAIVTFNEFGIQVADVNNQLSLDEWAGVTLDVAGGRVEMPGFVSQWHKKYPGLMFAEENGAGLTVENRHILPDDPESDFAVQRMTGKSKPRIVNQFKLARAGGLVIITSKRLFYQLLMYEDLGQGKYGAPEGQHDDLVTAALWAYDALVEMGGYEFDMPAKVVGTEMPMMPSGLLPMEDLGMAGWDIAAPQVGSQVADAGALGRWHEFDPRRIDDGFHYPA